MSDEPKQAPKSLRDHLAQEQCDRAKVVNCWRDRLPDAPTPEQLRFALGLSRPPWWRPVARWRWRKRNEKLLRDCNKETK